MKNSFIISFLLSLSLTPLFAAELQIVESVPEEIPYGSEYTLRPKYVWLDMINGAKSTLDFEEFYIAEQEGEDLTDVLNAIKHSVERGVKVRFLVDYSMMRETGKPLSLLRKAGVDTRVINFRKNGAGGVQHSKFFIVDGKEVFMGSQNFDWRSLSQIHEVGVRIKSKRAAKDFSLIFEDDWALASGKTMAKDVFKAQAENPITRLNPEKATLNGAKVSYSLAFGPVGFINDGFDSELSAILRIINKAKKSIYGQVMSYHLDEYGSGRWAVLDEAFRAAGKRGVSVNLVFADWTMGGRGDEDIKSLAKAENVIVKIAALPENTKKGFIPFARVQHSKYITADGNKSLISTSNWGPSYFTTSRGSSIIINGVKGAQVLESVFKKIWNGPYVELVNQNKNYKSVKRTLPKTK